MGFPTEADWASTSDPKLTSTYTSVINTIRYRDEDVARQFNDSDNAVLGTNHVEGTIRWDGTNKKWVTSNGSGTWADLVASGTQYAVDVSKVVGCAPNNAAGINNLSRNNNTLQNTLVSQYLGASGQDAAYFRNASSINAGTIDDARLPDSISSDITGKAATATSITVTANNATDETAYPLFVDSATGTSLSVETDTGFTYNPSTGALTSTKFAGNLDGVVGGTTPAAVTGTVITANTNFAGNLTGNVTGIVGGTTPAAVTATSITTPSVGKDSTDYITWTDNASTNFFVNGAECFRVVAGGDIHADGDVVAYSTTISDERLKTGITTVQDALTKVLQLNGVEFTRKNNGQRSAGVIAQQVEKVLPQAIREKKLPLQTGTDEMYKTVEYDALHSLYIEAIKELKQQLDDQALEIKELKKG